VFQPLYHCGDSSSADINREKNAEKTTALIWIKAAGTGLADALDGTRGLPATSCREPEVQKMIRTVVSIDEDLCNGCGECVPACEEGAIQIIHGKARLLSDGLCDGLGACLGHCPQGAIEIESREAEPFDEEAVRRHLAESEPIADRPSALTHWPVQLRLLPATAPVLRGARLLVAADCVPVAYAGFHSELLRDRAVAIGCPKLDDLSGYVEKLAEVIRHNDLTGLTVAHMEVPCCTGILRAVLEARRLAGSDLPVEDLVISIQGQLIERREIPAGIPMPVQSEPVFQQITGVE
jgi:ferredoxin